MYVWDKVPSGFRRPIILHEVVEADLYIHQNISKSKAHGKAVDLDKRFAKETLDAQTLAEYEAFRAKGGEFFG